ncbi:MAG: hypothetical protein KJO07_09435, partial [Deltaproteobacteria bacterium]|nr:hypothetical protein [Deltaproteobacteria bacterium]
MTEFSPLIDNPPLEADQARQLLERILEDARQALSEAIMVFDLDSTLLNNSPRQAKIMRDYGRDHGLDVLQRVQGEHWSGWDPRIPMRKIGLDQAQVDEHYDAFRAYWWERFFAGDYCVEDEPIAGARDYVDSVIELGARVFYVTGRHEAMREGTLACFERHG